MTSQRRINSSRANGAKSRGPVTPEGKRKSSKNSTRHGFVSGIILLEDEEPKLFTELLDGLMDEFDPQSTAQRELIETMAAARWRLYRIWEIERATLQEEVEKHNSELPSATMIARAFRDLANNTRTLDLLARYETRYDRQFARSLNLFMKLANPDNPVTQNFRANLIPEPDTTYSDVDREVGAAVEDASPLPDAAPAPCDAAPSVAEPEPPASVENAPPTPISPRPETQSHDFATSHNQPLTPLPRAG